MNEGDTGSTRSPNNAVTKQALTAVLTGIVALAKTADGYRSPLWICAAYDGRSVWCLLALGPPQASLLDFSTGHWCA